MSLASTYLCQVNVNCLTSSVHAWLHIPAINLPVIPILHVAFLLIVLQRSRGIREEEMTNFIHRKVTSETKQGTRLVLFSLTVSHKSLGGHTKVKKESYQWAAAQSLQGCEIRDTIITYSNFYTSQKTQITFNCWKQFSSSKMKKSISTVVFHSPVLGGLVNTD